MMIVTKIALGIACYFAVIVPVAVVLGRLLRGPVTPRPVRAAVEPAIAVPFAARETAAGLVA